MNGLTPDLCREDLTAEHTEVHGEVLENDSVTSIERKLRMLQLQGIKGEAVINYCDPLITQKMGYYRLSRRVNKMKLKMLFIPLL